MKLSEAMRLGAMLKPQMFGVFYEDGRTCAVGAALDASGVLLAEDPKSPAHNVAFRRMFPILTMLPVECPQCGANKGLWSWGAEFKVAHLNDQHRWTREQIADWIEGIERAQEQPQAAEMSTLA